jgi:type IV secretory pathway VirB3-like protein
VVALIAVPLVEMAKKAGVNYKNLWFPLLTALLVGVWFVSPMYLILGTIAYSVRQSLRSKQT